MFAYGSLVSRASFAETLGREPADLVAARLPGWVRRWSIARDNLAAEKTFADPSGTTPPWIIGLNLERSESTGDPAPNGALIEVTEAELERLDLREMRYLRVNLDASFAADAGFDRVVAYTARPQHYSPEPPQGAVAMASYLRAIEAAFRSLGEGQWELFVQTTGLPPVDPIEPVLVRDEIPLGNPRAW